MNPIRNYDARWISLNVEPLSRHACVSVLLSSNHTGAHARHHLPIQPRAHRNLPLPESILLPRTNHVNARLSHTHTHTLSLFRTFLVRVRMHVRPCPLVPLVEVEVVNKYPLPSSSFPYSQRSSFARLRKSTWRYSIVRGTRR